MMSRVGRETGYLLFSGHDGSKHPWRRQVASVVKAEKPGGEQKDHSHYQDSEALLPPGSEREYGMGQGLGCTHKRSILEEQVTWHEKNYKQEEKNVFALNYNL